MIQIRNVPDHVHRLLKARAALVGKSLSDLVREELELMVALPSPRELQQRLANAERFGMALSSADLIRHECDNA
ncbi:MAG: hypothetical protein COS34_12155 [Lysobacterales bacterium CG02_land_8_20_14_3_00_62_12]|nr:MAG: hypothetical protein COS34_12155 [Xanthomonadales bacterium CG02_land_8_20_14_3_00_62_12]